MPLISQGKNTVFPVPLLYFVWDLNECITTATLNSAAYVYAFHFKQEKNFLCHINSS